MVDRDCQIGMKRSETETENTVLKWISESESKQQSPNWYKEVLEKFTNKQQHVRVLSSSFQTLFSVSCPTVRC
jgi:uncharacterized membrane protein YfbV (UPF0208 family)